MARRILWCSRHRPLKAQLDFMDRLGEYRLEVFSGRVPNAEWLVENVILPRGIDVVVPVLPLSMVARLVELSGRHGFQVWWAEMELLHNDPYVDGEPSKTCPLYDDYGDVMVLGSDEHGRRIYRHYRFRRFRRVKRIVLELEDLA